MRLEKCEYKLKIFILYIVFVTWKMKGVEFFTFLCRTCHSQPYSWFTNLGNIILPEWHFQKPPKAFDSRKHCGGKAELVTTLHLTYHNEPLRLSQLPAYKQPELV